MSIVPLERKEAGVLLIHVQSLFLKKIHDTQESILARIEGLLMLDDLRPIQEGFPSQFRLPDALPPLKAKP